MVIMEEKELENLETSSPEEIEKRLKIFNAEFENHFEAVGLNREIYSRLWKILQNILCNLSLKHIHLTGLKSLRILSRDKVALHNVIEHNCLQGVLRLAGLVPEEEALHSINELIDYNVVIESQKVLSNMILNNTNVQQMCISNSSVPGLMCRLKLFKDPDLPHEVKCFDLKIIFLLTALCPDIRIRLRTEYHCLSYLIDILDEAMRIENETLSNVHTKIQIVFQTEMCDLLILVLKALYNLVLHIDRNKTDEEDEAYCRRLIIILRKLLLSQTRLKEKTEELHSNTINLLLLMPLKLYQELTPAMPKLGAVGPCVSLTGLESLNLENKDIFVPEYDGYNVSAVQNLLTFLELRLKNPGRSVTDGLSPILTLMCELSKFSRIIRKFIRMKVLPPLRDVSRRPEEGEEIKNHLCTLMTSPRMDVKMLASNFLFVLCKENVDRFIKYTGFGNAAGLLATRGLMLGDPQDRSLYSSDSDSETEEYEQIKDKVNPVTGRFSPPRPSPLASMTDEQKEVEALKLVNALDKLTRSGIIKPCRIGTDGKPQPIESVLELQSQSDQPSIEEVEAPPDSD